MKNTLCYSRCGEVITARTPYSKLLSTGRGVFAV